MVITKKTITYFLFFVLILANLTLALFPAWRGSFIWNYVSDKPTYFKLVGYSAMFFNFLISIIVLFLNTRIYGKWKFFFCFFSMSVFMLSMFQKDINVKQIEGIMAMSVYIILVNVLPQYEFGIKMKNGILILLLLWSIIPIVCFFIVPVTVKLLFLTDSGTFSGFALHRNFYGVYAGITFLLLFFIQWPKFYRYLFCCILLVGLFMSESRTVVLCIFISLIYKKKAHKKYFYIYFILLSVIGAICYFLLVDIFSEYMVRKDLDNNVTRQDLYLGFWQIFTENPILGRGENVLYYSLIHPEGSPAHNFILQILANNGIIELLFFVLFYIAIFRSFSTNARCLFLFLIVTGMFQPYVDAGFPTTLTVIVLFICHVYSDTKRKIICKKMVNVL